MIVCHRLPLKRHFVCFVQGASPKRRCASLAQSPKHNAHPTYTLFELKAPCLGALNVPQNTTVPNVFCKYFICVN